MSTLADLPNPSNPRTGAESSGCGIKNTRVFIAEDHVSLRQLLATHLRASSRYEVVGETDQGQEIADACERLRPHVLVLDLNLPDEDGLNIVAAVRSRSPETHILVFSAQTDAATVRRALELGVCGFIEKTSSIDVLDRAISAASLGQPFFGDHILQTLPAVLRGEISQGTSKLSARECEVLALVANGQSSREIASSLGLSVRTVENHRSNIMHALGARNTADLTREAMRMGLVSVEPRRR